MKKSFGKWFAVPLSTVLLSSFAFAPVAEARGGGRGGGAAAIGGGGAQGHNVQVNNSNRDVRANNVRNTSVNNVNVNRNVNVNVNQGGGWNDHYHPVATAAAVTATVAVTAAVVGSIVRTVPPNCSPYSYNGIAYQQCGGTWYQPQYVGNQVQYVVVNPPN